MLVPGKEDNTIDFSIVFKKPETYTSFALDITNNGQEILIINMDFQSS